MLIICDIDGTIADIRDREEKAGMRPSEKNRRAFQGWLDRLQKPKDLLNDPPIREVLSIVRHFVRKNKGTLIYLTGRHERYRTVTKKWLRMVKAPKGELWMRPMNDWRSARFYKRDALEKLVKLHSGPYIVLDDDGAGDCTSLYRQLGLLHLQVRVPPLSR